MMSEKIRKFLGLGPKGGIDLDESGTRERLEEFVGAVATGICGAAAILVCVLFLWLYGAWMATIFGLATFVGGMYLAEPTIQRWARRL